MADTSQPPVDQRFKAEMPQIPGVSGEPARQPSSSGGPWLMIGGIAAVLLAIFVATRLFSRPRRPETAPAPAAQIDVPAIAPEIPVPVASSENSPIASISDLAKAWDSRQFTYHNRETGENVPALVIRLPQGSASQASGYWSIAMRAAYSNCRLEYVEDLDKLATDYGYKQARHPLIGNPCNRTLYDPLKYATLPGNILARGAIVSGSDLRPPLGIEIRVRGKDLVAIRME